MADRPRWLSRAVAGVVGAVVGWAYLAQRNSYLDGYIKGRSDLRHELEQSDRRAREIARRAR